MLSENKAKWWLNIIIPVFITVLSICILSAVFPKTGFIVKSIENLEESKTQVLDLTGATMAVSLAISALPGDFASPMANTLADLNKYFVVLLAIIFIEKLIIIEGIKVSFIFLIPIACFCYILSVLLKREFWVKFAYKILVFTAAIVFVVPCSIQFVDLVGKDYLYYVDETIEAANVGAQKITDVSNDGNNTDSIFDKLTNAFTTASKGMDDMMNYFNNVMKKSINSIAILLVTTFVMPMLTLFFFKWLVKELFGINFSFDKVRSFTKGIRNRKKDIKSNISGEV